MWLIDHFMQYMAERRRAEQAEAQRRADMQQQIATGAEAAHQHWLDNRDGYRRRQAIREAEQRIIADEANEYSVFGMLDVTESDKARHKREVDEMAQRLDEETDLRMGRCGICNPGRRNSDKVAS